MPKKSKQENIEKGCFSLAVREPKAIKETWNEELIDKRTVERGKRKEIMTFRNSISYPLIVSLATHHREMGLNRGRKMEKRWWRA